MDPNYNGPMGYVINNTFNFEYQINQGGIMMAMAGVTSVEGLFAARFFLGVTEAGITTLHYN